MPPGLFSREGKIMTKIILGKSNMWVFLKILNKTCNENICRGKFKNCLQRHFLFRVEMNE